MEELACEFAEVMASPRPPFANQTDETLDALRRRVAADGLRVLKDRAKVQVILRRNAIRGLRAVMRECQPGTPSQDTTGPSSKSA